MEEKTMFTFWSKDNEKALSVSFDKNLFKNGIKTYKSVESVKGIDSLYQKSISIFGIIITISDFNYNRIIHIMINHQKDNYTSSDSHNKISILKETLFCHIKNNDYKKCNTPFNWNYSLNTENGEIVYYITGNKEWFIKNNLEDLVSGYVEICGRDKILENIDRFPKYDLRKTSNVIGFFIN